MSKRVGHFLVNIIPREHQWKMKLFYQWDDIIGKLKDKVRIEKICDNSLTLGVCHPAWAQELFTHVPLLKQKINDVLREEKIKFIRFKSVDFSIKTQNRTDAAGKCDTLELYSNDDEREHCLTICEHTSLQSVQNSDLQNALSKFYCRCKKVRRIKGRKK